MSTTTTAQPLDRILDALHYQGSRSGTKFKCHCPSHDDGKESLSVSVGFEDKVLLKCHAGCDTNEVLAKIGLKTSDLFAASFTKPKRQAARIVATYDYRDESGKLLYQVVRNDPKGFKQRRPDEKKGWVWSLNGVRRILYRLEELLAADPQQWVFVPEGEKDVDNLRAQGLVATTNAQGAAKWESSFNECLKDRRVCILPDNDDPGRKHAYIIAKGLLGVAAQVRVLALPDLPVKGDVSDWLAASGDADKLLVLVEETPDYTVSLDATSSDGTDGSGDTSSSDKDGKKAQADILYELASSNAEIFTAQDGKAYAFVPVGNHRECYSLQNESFSGWLTALYRAKFGRMPGGKGKEDAIKLLAWDARSNRQDIFVRVAGFGGKVYIDLGTEEWDALEVDDEGWRVVPRPPVAFRRANSLKPLPLPQKGSRLSLLRKYLNIEPEHWPLIAAWIVAALHATGPYPILVLAGEQGTAKSTTLRVLKELIDPAAAGLRGQPSEIRDLMIGAQNGWMLAFDNVSQLSSDLSDALCRVATGGGYAKRANYSDDGEVLIDAQRPIAINGIGDIITRSDLMDRSILLCPPVISEGSRRGETEFWREFNQDRPLILGALLDALSVALRNFPQIQLPSMPRMADFFKLAVAAESEFDADISFLDAYQANREEANATVVETSTLGEHLRDLVLVTGQWEGTASDLLSKLNNRASESERRAQTWPKAPNKVNQALQRLAPSLRIIGVAIEHPPRTDKAGTKRIRIVRVNS